MERGKIRRGEERLESIVGEDAMVGRRDEGEWSAKGEEMLWATSYVLP